MGNIKYVPKQVKPTKIYIVYYATVEGETEKWYFKRAEDMINNELSSMDSIVDKVSFQCTISKDPLKYIKSFKSVFPYDIYHVMDYESSDEIHQKPFVKALDRMIEAEFYSGVTKYHLCYSNLTFDLWIVLHKMDCRMYFHDRKDYLKPINSAFSENFTKLDNYKSEKSFKKILNSLTFNDLKIAIERCRAIMKINIANNSKKYQYKGFEYYQTNPSFSLWEFFDTVIKEIGL
jgi:uncharacterized C2H2 Zn-finger protein